MKCLFILISTGLNIGSLAATTFQSARIDSYSKYAQCCEFDPISRLKNAPFTLRGWLNLIKIDIKGHFIFS